MSTHSAKVALALTLLAASGCSASPSEPAGLPRAASEGVWQRVESEAGHFSIAAPARAQRRVEREERDGIVAYEIGFEDHDASYAISYSDLGEVAPSDRDRFLDAMVERIAERSALPVRSERTLTMRGQPARELDFRGRDGPFASWRYLMAGQRFFQLGVTSAENVPERAERFFASFEPHEATGMRSFPEAGIDLVLPNAEWHALRTGREGNEHWSASFVRGSEAPAPSIVLHVERVSPETSVMAFSIYRDGEDDFASDENCEKRNGPRRALCRFGVEDGTISLRHAVGGFRHRYQDGESFAAYVVHAVYFDRGITIVMAAPEDDFAAVEPEFRQVLRSLHAHPLD